MKQRFLIYGMSGWCLEVFWTGIGSLLKADVMMTGRSSIWMFFIYGLAVFLEPVCDKAEGLPTIIRGAIYASLIFAVEFVTGYMIRLAFGAAPWDYSHNPYNIAGLIRLDYAPLWFIVGLLFEKYRNLVRNRQTLWSARAESE